MLEFIKIVILSILAAVTYGMVHDQITARICVEYFTLGHPKIIESTDPTALAFAWGVVATWWVGLPLGVVLGMAALVGSWPRLSARQLIKPLACLLLVMFVGAAAAGVVGYFTRNNYILDPELSAQLSSDTQDRFIVNGFAHSASYFLGEWGGLVLSGVVLWRRSRLARRSNGVNAPPEQPTRS